MPVREAISPEKSRKSTQKRQKQYFEQRKRKQEQDHSSSVIESYAYNKVPSTQCHEKKRSLDILSLFNLSKHGQDCSPRLPEEGRGSPNGKSTTPNYQTTHCPNAVRMEIKNGCSSEHVVIRETGIASNHLKETESSQDHPDASRRNQAKYPMKTTTDYKMSVIDLLGDDGPNSSSRENFVHENHVSFSVEGLGKVGTETPVHSPQHPTRNFSYKCSAPPKISKGFHSFKNIDCSVDDQFSELVKEDHMAFGVDFATDDSCLELPPYLIEKCHNSKQKTVVGKESLLQNAKDFLSNDKSFDSRLEFDELNWHEESSFLDDNYCGLPRKNRSCDLDSCILNPTGRRNCNKPDFSFEGVPMQKRRLSEKAASSLNGSASYSSYKRQMEHGYDFMASNMKRYPTCDDNWEFGEMTHCSAWPSFEKEDARECLSFLSEDSCLSLSVWREGTINPSFNGTVRRKTKGPEADFRRPVVDNICTKNNTCTEEFWQQESGISSRACNMMSEFSTPGDDWIFEEQCNIKNVKPGYVPLNAFETQKSPPFGCKHWAEETFDQAFNPKVYGNEKSPPSRSEQDAFSGNLFSVKDGFCEQFSPSHSSHISKSNNVECGHQESFHGLFKEEKDSHTMQFQESVSTGENRSATLPAISSTLDQINYSSSTKETPMDVLESEDNHSQFEESKVKTPELNPRQNVVLSPLRSDGGSSSVEMPQTLEEFKEHSNGTQTSLMSQNEHEVIEDSGRGKGDLKH
uniref:uncharacterized protein LOC122609298 n=1 Tax=Erigeron canadensis TaxID=72917 RepID=UPI001CB8E707|nr:uncharacterized protein LOC122609298 [Erigeron canadensis]